MAVGVVVALYLDVPGWQGGAVGLAVALLLVTPSARHDAAAGHRRCAGVPVGPAPTEHGQAAPAEPFDVSASDGVQIGFRWDGTTLLSLMHIDANPQAMTVMEPGTTVSGEVVPVQTLVDCLRQFDITLDSIDIISQGARSRGHTDVAAVYDAVLGPLPAIATAHRVGRRAVRSVAVRRGRPPPRRWTRGHPAHRDHRHPAGGQPADGIRAAAAHSHRERHRRGHQSTQRRRRPRHRRGNVGDVPGGPVSAVQLRGRARVAHHGRPWPVVDGAELLDDGVCFAARRRPHTT